MKIKFYSILFTFFIVNFCYGQEPYFCEINDTIPIGLKDLTSCGDLNNYKLDKTSSYQFSPVYRPNVQIHVFQYSASDPRNFTVADLGDLNTIMLWINDIFRDMQPPTRPQIPAADEETDSRIEFNFLPVEFIVDPVAWDRGPTTQSSPLTINSFVSLTQVDINGPLPFSPVDCIQISGTAANDGAYKVLSAVYDSFCNCTHITISSSFVSTTGSGNAVLMQTLPGLNCSSDIFTAYHSSSLNTIHVYYTSFSNLCTAGFGCGPSPYWCNLSSPYPPNPVGYYALAQLTAHELGHCLGLNHTADNNVGCPGNIFSNIPLGITDLPPNDCMGFIPCNTTTTSNNIMGYNQCRNYFSPLQIAYMRRKLSTDVFRINYLKECDYDATETVTISGSVIWDNKEVVGGDIIIPNGASLTIQCRVNMPKGSVIKVHPGGKLIVDGGTLTNLCGEWWQGIEAIGNPSNHIQNSLNQATVIIKNNALIENAYVAIRGGEVDPSFVTKFNQGGAIIQASNSTFKNNWWSIQFSPYKRTTPSGIEVNNASYVKNCTFLNDAPLTNPAHIDPTHSVSIWDARGIPILGCTFESTRTDNTENLKGVGITLIDANNTNIAPLCTTPLFPCPAASEDRNEFKNLYIGIETLLGTGADNLTVSRNNFTNCVYGIKSSGSAYTKATLNKFEIPFATGVTWPGYSTAYTDAFGIFFDGNYGYNIEENNFIPYQNGEPQHNVGVLTRNSSAITSGNQIYRNDFGDPTGPFLYKGLTLGVQTQDNNSTLPIDCNRFYEGHISTYIDIHWATGTFADQGLCHPTIATRPQANEFTGTCTMSPFNSQIWRNVGYVTGDAAYYSYSTVGYVDGCNDFGVYSNDCLGNEPLPYDRNVACPSTLIPTTINVTKAMLAYNDAKSQITALNSLIDGGNTVALVNFVNTTNSNWQLRDHLMTFAPNISDDVLITLLKKNSPAVATWVIEEVFNSCGPLSEKVLKVVLERTPSLPPYLIRNLFVASAPVRKDVMISLINKSGIPPWVIEEVAVANAPMYSEEVVALINRTPKLSPSVLNNILVVNTPLTQPVIDALNARTPALPQWVWNNIDNSTYVADHPDTRVKTLSSTQNIMNTIKFYNIDKLYNLSWLVSHYLDSNYVDSALSILNTDGSIEAMCALAPVQIERGKFPDADITLTFIYNRAIYKQTIDADDPEAKNLLDFCLFHNTVKLVKGQPNGYFSLTPPQITTLEGLAHGNSAVAANARAILNFINSVKPYEPAFLIEENLNPRSFEQPRKVLVASAVNLHCYPNPNNGAFTIEISGLDEAANGQLFIFDMVGQLAQTIQVNDEFKSISVGGLSTGIYQVVYSQNGKFVANEKLIVTK